MSADEESNRLDAILSQSDNDSLLSLSSSDEDQTYREPPVINNQQPNDDKDNSKRRRSSNNEVKPLERMRRRSSVSQYSTRRNVVVGSSLVETLSRGMSRRSQDSSSVNLGNDQDDSLSVKELYPNMDEEQVQLARAQTRGTILTTLSERVAKTVSRNTEILNQEEPRNEHEQKEQDEQATEENESDDNENEIFPEVPENNYPVKDYGDEFASIDPELVTWDGPEDPQFPRNWSNKRKYTMTFIIAINTIVSPISSSMLSPGLKFIVADFGVTSSVLQTLIISIFILAWALCPLIVAPCSEMFGRKIVLVVSIWFLFFFNLACGLSQNLAQMCIFRFLAGCGGAAPLSVGPGVLGDLYDARTRSTAMAFYSIGPTLGPVLAPIMAGFIVEKLNWRWIFWVLCMINGAVAVMTTTLYAESYSPVLLKRKAMRLRKLTGNNNLTTIFEISDAESMKTKILLNAKRPLKLLCTNPMVFGLGLFMAFVYGFMYLLISTFPSLWGGQYGFSSGISGLLFIPMGVGFCIGIVVWAYYVNKIYRDKTEANGGIGKPEFRLPCLIWAGVGCPIGLIWYGWTAEKQLHWILPSIGSAIFAFFLIVVFQTIQNYLIDMNPRFAASSAAAAATFRSIFGFVFPLFSGPMYDALGYGWGNTMFAFIGFLLGIPFPLFLLKYGERLRLWANARMELEQAERDAKNLAKLQNKKGN